MVSGNRVTGKILPVVAALALVAPAAPTAAMPAAGDGSAAPAKSLRAAPPLLRFAVIGDFGTSSSIQNEVANRMCRWRTSHPFDLVITTGDNIYPDGSASYFEPNFFQPYECLLDNGVSFHATLGNHDVATDNGAPELGEPAFGMPKRNYVFRDSGVRFVMVNSNAIRRDWLRQATRARSGDLWTVVAFHHPVFSPGEHGSTPGLRPWMPRLFRRRGVDVVFNGHDHLYAVSRPIKRVRYVVTGGGGAGLYPCHDRWFSAICRERHHFTFVRVDVQGIRMTAVPRRGKPFHSFTTTGSSSQ
jgi:3',5'-cyclic AMP phosphodiesterase CpdA